MKATLIAAQKTPLSLLDCLWAFRIAYEKLEGIAPSIDCLALLVGQSALETGNWRSMYCYNFGNAKASPRAEGFYCQFPCSEVDSNGVEHHYRPPHPQTNFRAYLSAPDGAVAALAIIRSQWPQAWRKAQQGDVTAFCERLRNERGTDAKGNPKAAYFTANLAKYTGGVARCRAQARAELERNRQILQTTPPAPPGQELRIERPTLRLGAKNLPYVRELQALLNEAGATPELVVDGNFWSKTEIAVKQYQSSHGLTADGVVGPITWQSLSGDASPTTERNS